MTRVAVLGAGFQGVCTALELATRGVDVDLYDRRAACITEAGAHNEGKIHLGFVYANDATFETTRLLVPGALAFDAALRRWLESDTTTLHLSTPHDYAVHRDSVLEPAAVLAHFTRVCDLVREIGNIRRCTYLGQDARTIGFEMHQSEDVYDPATIAAVIRTDERAVDTKHIAQRLRLRVAAEPRIRFHSETQVVSATRNHGTIRIELMHEGARASEQYRQAVNCLWSGKLAIDRDMDFLPAYRSLHRMKYGIHAVLSQPNESIRSVTFVVGPFGDIVRFDDRRAYFSWYPVARTGISHALTAPDWPTEITGAPAQQMVERTLEAFGRLMRPVRALPAAPFSEASVSGGIILAAGDTDIHDPNSGLHARSSVGVRSHNGYHSVDTGKYTLAPLFAMEVADRVCGT